MAKAKVKTRAKAKAKEETYGEQLKRLVGQINDLWVEFSVIAFRAYTSDDYVAQLGYENLKDFVEKELNLEYRTFMNRVHMGEVIVTHGLTPSMIQKIGSSKFKEIAYLINKDSTRDEINSLVKKASKSSARELKEYVRSVRLDKEGKTRITKNVTMKFKLVDDQAEIVQKAIEDVKEKLLSRDSRYGEGMALTVICGWYLAEAMEKEIPEDILKAMEESEIEEQRVSHKTHANKGKKRSKK